MTDSVHWDWLHGPAQKPDPRIGDMSASTAHRGPTGPVLHVWDHWLNQPADIRLAERGDAA